VNDFAGDRDRPIAVPRARKLAPDCSETGTERSPYEHDIQMRHRGGTDGCDCARGGNPQREARNGRNAAAIGFGVGAIAGAAIAGSAYNNGYYGYYGEPGYAYGYARVCI
jgi:hypothetical protein